MTTIYDTNVLIDYPDIIKEEDDIAIPYSILDELENLKYKKRLTYKARKAIRNILKMSDKIEFISDDNIDLDSVDDVLVEVALRTGYKLITQDILLYLRGREFLADKISFFEVDKDIYTGVSTLESPQINIDNIYEQGYLEADDIEIGSIINQNEFLDLGRVILRKKEDKFFKVEWEEGQPFISKDFKLNRRQLMAHELLMDTTVPLVAIWGKYGTGKTSLTIRTALKMFNKDLYEKIIVTRPKIESGFKEEHLGTLPGDVDEKYTPYLKPFQDNSTPNQFKMFEVQPLSTIKGRDIKNTLFILDEAQDVNPEKMPMIIERLGCNSKLVLLGDPNQVDNPYLNKYENGLVFAINNLKNSPYFGCIELEENERSKVAMLGEDLRKCLR